MSHNSSFNFSKSCVLFSAVLGLHHCTGFSLAGCAGFSSQCLLLLRSRASGMWGRLWLLPPCSGTQAQQWAYLLRGVWDPPRPETKLMSPGLAGRFFTSGSPGKPWFSIKVLGFGEWWASTGFNFKSLAALAPNKRISLPFKVLKPDIDFPSPSVQVPHGIFFQ